MLGQAWTHSYLSHVTVSGSSWPKQLDLTQETPKEVASCGWPPSSKAEFGPRQSTSRPERKDFKDFEERKKTSKANHANQS